MTTTTTAPHTDFIQFAERWEIPVRDVKSPSPPSACQVSLPRLICEFAAFTGDLTMLKFLESEKLLSKKDTDDQILMCAIASSDEDDATFEFFKPYFEEAEKKDAILCFVAAKENQFDRLKWLHDFAKYPLSAEIFEWAVGQSSEHTLFLIEWLIERNCPRNADVNLFSQAVNIGVIKLLDSKLPGGVRNPEAVLVNAQKYGRADIVEWLKKEKISPPPVVTVVPPAPPVITQKEKKSTLDKKRLTDLFTELLKLLKEEEEDDDEENEDELTK